MVENDYGHLSETHKTLLVFQMLLGVEEEELMKIPSRCLSPALWWMTKNLLEERIMKLDFVALHSIPLAKTTLGLIDRMA